ncbi:MAG: hypothetical protein DWQ44_05930 [Bacteroidetes bacterium]|nr:MAG: hypothetical protein DWQ33_12860 [Bacteroidota bacterium]REK03442.1 MAG: hypothetical protein DWQ39_09590 [Bacteroidota bacterium]REK34446.1 MAG: hypothetical protein DWQ44_05930 [Bacteroidota bacterium]REK50436.1 MAG: hypothetical protein DWQ48_03740 [Bacteroidota bacterium]
MRLLKIAFLFAVALTIFSSCKKLEEYPVIPSIEYKNMFVLQDAGGFDEFVRLVIAFTDGDGDIGYHAVESGLNDPIFDDPASAYYYNYSAKVFQFVNGVWSEVTSPIPISGRLPYMTPEGPNKALKGEIDREFNVPPGLIADTIRFEVFIYDRALHKSNTLTTPAVIITSR